MSHDPNHMREASRRLTRQREDRRMEVRLREQKTYAALPALEELDKRIQSTVAMAVAAALRTGVDPAPAVEEARKQNLAYQGRRLELLKSHGIDPESLEERPACALCNDSGWVNGAPCRCLEKLCAQENLRELSEQLDLEEMDFGKFSLDWYAPQVREGLSPRECMETVVTVCRDFSAQFPKHAFRNLYLYGGTGLGKTFLSGCIAKEVAKRGFWTVYETAGALFRQYETAKFSREQSEAAERQVARYEKCDLLILDDLGSEMTTPFVLSALYQLVNQRINAGAHTVISSNLNLDGIRERYSPQVASRLEGEYRGLPFLGEDIRVQKKRR